MGIMRIRYTVRYVWIRIIAMRTRYLPRIGTVRYRYLYAVGKLYTVFIRRESDAALDATAAVQGKQSAAITSIHDGKHKYHSPK